MNSTAILIAEDPVTTNTGILGTDNDILFYIIGGVVLLFLCILSIFCVRWQKKRSKANEPTAPQLLEDQTHAVVSVEMSESTVEHNVVEQKIDGSIDTQLMGDIPSIKRMNSEEKDYGFGPLILKLTAEKEESQHKYKLMQRKEYQSKHLLFLLNLFY